MIGLEGFGRPTIANVYEVAVGIAALAAIALLAPNTQEILAFQGYKLRASGLRWRPNAVWALALGCLFGIAVAGTLTKPTAFLYFRF